MLPFEGVLERVKMRQRMGSADGMIVAIGHTAGPLAADRIGVYLTDIYTK
jgi:hypothetical protein